VWNSGRIERKKLFEWQIKNPGNNFFEKKVNVDTHQKMLGEN
jgi:hypothetical protein